MSQPCACQSPNPLVRDGTSQASRALAALDPARVPVDGRNMAALLEYLRRYAKTLQYYDLANTRAGSWEPFVAGDVSSVAAAVAAEDAERERRRLLELARKAAGPGGGGEAFSGLLDALFAIALKLDRWAALGAEGLRFREVLLREIHGGLRADLQRLLGIHRGARALGLPSGSQVSAEGLSSLWGPPEGPPPDVAAFGPGGLPEWGRLGRALEHLRPLLRSFPRALARVADAASGDLERTIADWPRHEPPMALVLAFLHLFRHAQKSLDGLTARHLEHHFQEVLGLRPRGPEPDRVFLTFELARHPESAILPAGTVAVGGKDAEGRPLRYALEEDLRVDHATVGPCMAVHRSAGGLLTAAPVASSADGLGAPLSPERPGWPAFGSDEHPPASVGFAFATRALLLAEGERLITFSLTLGHPSGQVEDLRAIDLLQAFRIELTGEEGWLQPRVREAHLNGSLVRIVLALSPEDPPVTGYRREVHGAGLDTAWPVCRFLLAQDEARGCTYQAFSPFLLTGAVVEVQVKGIRNLHLETDAGRAQTTKPFMPFGAQPLPGSAFSVRCPELESKTLTSLALDLRWLDPAPGLDLRELYAKYALEPPSRSGPSGAEGEAAQDAVTLSPPVERGTFKVEVSVGLAASIGASPGSTRAGGLFDAETFTIRPDMLSSADQHRPVDTVRVRLIRPLHGFGHRLYPLLHAQAAIALSRGDEGHSLPPPPVTPTLAALSLSYSARSGFGAGAAQQDDGFFHIHPFGETREEVGAGTTWLPSYLNEGELYLGLAHTRTRQRISLLFEAVEGSGDPLLQAEAVGWAYLDAGQRFRAFPAEALGDGTGGLVRSGLVRLVLPAGATDAGKRLPAGCFWIRASVPARSAAACRLIAVHAQAGSAVLLDADQHPTHLSRALPAGKVGELERRQAAIKKVHQPIASFGGRAPEAPLAFARRASERLRHKQRAITPADYERLVLEAFPSLYKVKCLNHTRLDAGGDVEIAPGWVTVVTVPNLVGRTGHDPFAPYTSQATLAAVADFLRPLVGGFVHLQVTNPVYEPLRLGFTVKLRPWVSDPAIGIARLKQEINAFLSPWAFEGGQGQDIVFGGAIHRSTLLHFVERRPSVDYVVDFRVSHLGGDAPSDEERLVARSSRSILVSAGDHDILPEPAEVRA